MKTITVLFALTLCLNSCEKTPLVDKFYSITVINNSSNNVYVHKADVHAEQQYPDISLPSTKTTFLKIPANKRGYFDSKTPWQENIKKIPSDTLSVFFIDGNTFETKDWEE